MHRSWLIGILCGATAFSQGDKQEERAYKGPLCLANFCFERFPLASEKELIARYGAGLKIGEARCYASSSQRAYVQFRVEQELPGKVVVILVSDVENCLGKTKAPPPRTSFPVFSTREGVRLGDTYRKVLRTYGKPTSVRDGTDATFKLIPLRPEHKISPFGEQALVYDGPSDDLIQAIFYVRKEKIAAIYISCSE